MAAQRVVITDVAGRTPNERPGYMASWQARFTGGVAGDTAFTLLNPVGSGKTLLISRAEIALGWDGANGIVFDTYSLTRFTSAVPSGGTAVVPGKVASVQVASVALAQGLTSGLTVAGIVWEATPIRQVARLRTNQYLYVNDIVFNEPIVVLAGEGLGFRLTAIEASGSGFAVTYSWVEI